MNNKILIAVVLAIVVVGVVALAGRKSNTQTPTQPVNQGYGSVQPRSSTATQTEEQTQEATVIITDSGFEPATVTIKAGTKVVWINKSGGAATVNSALHPTHLIYPQLNLNDVPNNESVSLVFYKVGGTYKYHNHLNPSQTGTVVVE